MILVFVFVLLFAWAVFKGMNAGLPVESSDFKKTQIEYVIPVRNPTEKEGKVLNMLDYLKEKEKLEKFEEEYGPFTYN